MVMSESEGDQPEDLNIDQDVKWLMADRRGRRVVRRLLSKSGVFRSSFQGDGLNTAFAEGGRNVGLYMLALVQSHCPDRLAEVLIESSDHD